MSSVPKCIAEVVKTYHTQLLEEEEKSNRQLLDGQAKGFADRSMSGPDNYLATTVHLTCFKSGSAGKALKGN